MKKNIFVVLLWCLAGCTSTHDKLKEQIGAALTAANQSVVLNKPDSVNIELATTTINDFVAQFPNDSLAPGFLFELALLYEKEAKYAEAIAVLEKISSKYPDSKQASKAVFLQGFLYANVLNQLDKAKVQYQFYLEKYSNVDAKITSDVQMELQNLGKTPEEILNEIQQKARQDTTQAQG